MPFTFRDIPIDVQRKTMRSLRLRVKTDGTVWLSVPRWVAQREIEDFLQARYDWLLQTRTRMLAEQEARKNEGEPLQTGSLIYLFGTPYRLQVLPTPIGNSVAVQGDTLILRCKEGADLAFRQAILDNFYKKELTQVLQPMLADWQRRLQETTTTWSIRKMRTEWGSCTPKRRTLRFNLCLAEKPMECIEYVVVHELTHLRIANHSKAFWDAVAQHIPDYTERKKRLNTHEYKPLQ